jgi:hypothetical protein
MDKETVFRILAYIVLVMYFIYISGVVPALTNTKQAAAVSRVGFGLWTLSLAITGPVAMIYHEGMLFATSPGGARNALTYSAASGQWVGWLQLMLLILAAVAAYDFWSS